MRNTALALVCVLSPVLFACGGGSGGGGLGGGTEYCANWSCGSSSQCRTVMGGWSGAQCGLTSTSCQDWCNTYIPGNCHCEPAGYTPPAPTITAISPTSGAAGDTITINGTNLPTAASGVSIDVGGVTLPVSITASSSTSLTFSWYNNTSPVPSVSGPLTLHSPAGQATSAATFTVLNDLNAVASSGTTFLAVGAAASAFESTDGVHWTPSATGADPLIVSFTSTAWVGGRFLAGGTNAYLFSTTDGATWTPLGRLPGQYGPTGGYAIYGITYTGSKYFTAGAQGAVVTSTDGTNWSWVNTPMGISYAIVWADGQLVAAGSPIVTSPDGVTWTQRSNSTMVFGVAWSGSTFVAVSGGGYILTSPDGMTWTSLSTGATTATLSGVTWFDGKFVAVGHGGTVITSPDGVNWTAQSSGTSQDLNAVAASGTRIVVVGKRGVVISSSDGVTWSAGTATP